MPRPEDSPWAVPVARLSSRAGQHQDVDDVFPAPDGIGDHVVGIKEGSDIRVTGSFDSIVDGLILSARISTRLQAECTRCLTPIDREWQASVTAFFPYEEPSTGRNRRDGRTGNHGMDDADDVAEILAGEEESEDTYPLSPDGGFADLEALLRDTFAEHLPVQLVCRRDCRGLCPQCGLNLYEPPAHPPELPALRCAGLAGLKARLEQQQ
ncbi:MAG: DUF177 domain-containing protein [Bifidobacterium mongoliense]|nr:DUF177 domain-containing protein [Bifidobacterium mongoliense]